MAELYKDTWKVLDFNEILFILLELIGRPGQYEDMEHPNIFSLPLAGGACAVRLTFSDTQEIVAIEPGPVFDANAWQTVSEQIEAIEPIKAGRDISFSGYRVNGSWRGQHSGVQILPPPAEAPLSPQGMAEHPFLIEFPVTASAHAAITNFRRQREHRRYTFLLNVLLSGGVTKLPRRQKHLWVAIQTEGKPEPDIRWAQEFYFANFGTAIQDGLSPPDAQPIELLAPDQYYSMVGHDGGALRLPADLDDSIRAYQRLSKGTCERFLRAAYWLGMASRQFSTSYSAAFSSLCIAIESLAGGDHHHRSLKFRTFIEQYAPGASLGDRRKEMYKRRSEILHGSGIMQLDGDGYLGWAPPARNDDQLMDELWALTRIAFRNWLKSPPPV
jgi:hypothetical protein